MSDAFIIGVVGNPNCGKTTLFNDLTGTKQRVGNWPGVTVERKTGDYSYKNIDFKLVDLPGTYSLDVAEENVSIDEQIARDYVAKHEADLIINILDASNLERNLYLTSELLEMRVPMLVALNMMDVAKERGYTINVDGLAEQLGCPVVPIVAASGKGLPELQETILKAAEEKHISTKGASYAAPIELAITKLLPEIEAMASDNEADPRWLAVRMLENDSLARRIAGDIMVGRLTAIQMETEQALGDDIDISLADSRYGFVNQVTTNNIHKKSQVQHSTSDRIDTVVLNRVLGIPIFLFMMYLMFMFTINIGGAFVDFFDIFSGTILVDGLSIRLGELGAPEWLIMLVANGIGNGIQVVATFIPIIGFLFLFLSILEDSGYMARAAFVMDRAMRAIGLPGKAFVSLIVGFGCTVPAVMATRTMEQERDRIMTIIMAPFMSCGARLPVYALFAAAFFPVGGQNIVFGLYIIGIAIAVLTGLIMKSTLLQGQTTPFIMELPPYHVPTITGVLLRTWDRTKSFIFNAGKIIIPMVLVLNLLNAIGTDGSYGNEDSNKSVLSSIGRTIAPAFSPMGMDEDNWPAAVGIFTGILAKEAVVGTLDSLYSELAKSDAEAAGITQDAEETFDFWGGINKALATIPANLADAMGSWGDPIGLEVGDVHNIEAAAEEQEVSAGTFGAMVTRFDGSAGAFAYLLMILLYFPCTAAIAAIYRETNMGWAMFIAGWTTSVAYIAATVFYQASIFSRHPMISLAWIGGMLAIFVCGLLILRELGTR